MILFLLFFLSLYGGLNFYAFFRARTVFQFSGKTEMVIAAVFIFMIFAPLIVRLLEKFSLETLARETAYCCYLWMAFVFLFFFINITFDLARFGLRFFYQNAGSAQVRNIFFMTAILLTLSIVVYGFFDARKIRTRKLEFQTLNPLPNNGRIRIAQISDVHIGLIVRDSRLDEILKVVESAKPDILISTGDLLDGEIDNISRQAKKLEAVKPPFGKYAITGNHEFYAGIEKSLEFTRSAGFEILRDEVRQIAGINIIGLDDITGKPTRKYADLSPDRMSALKKSGFVLLLKHQPFIDKNEFFDLQLSGHTHGGQIFPFILITKIFFPHSHGFYKLNEEKFVYISRGTGTWGPPVRFLAPPEVTIIDITSRNI